MSTIRQGKVGLQSRNSNAMLQAIEVNISEQYEELECGLSSTSPRHKHSVGRLCLMLPKYCKTFPTNTQKPNRYCHSRSEWAWKEWQ